MEMLKIMDINRETIISEILSNFPEAMPKFQELGMHCLGCALATASNKPVLLTALILMSSSLSSRHICWLCK